MSPDKCAHGRNSSTKKYGETKACTTDPDAFLFCGWSYYYRTILCREHQGLLGLGSGWRQVQKCKPYPEDVESYVQVVETRFVSRHSTTERVMDQKVYKFSDSTPVTTQIQLQ